MEAVASELWNFGLFSIFIELVMYKNLYIPLGNHTANASTLKIN